MSEDGLKGAGILADESSDVSQLRMVENGAQLLDTQLLSASFCGLALPLALGWRRPAVSVRWYSVEQVLNSSLYVVKGCS